MAQWGGSRQMAARLGVVLLAPAIPVVALGIILSSHTREWSTDRATENSADAARLVADIAISPLLEPSDFTTTSTDPARRDELDAALQQFIGEEIVRIKIWDATGRIIYSDDHDTIGVTYPISHELEDAVAGEVSSEVSTLDKSENASEQDFDRLLEVYVPLRSSPDGPVEGAFEIYLPYAPIEEAINADTRRILIIVAATLVLLYLALARVSILWTRSHQRAEDKEHEANHDPLTGLPNRRKFQAILETIAEKNSDQQIAVMFLDLDDFKTVNDQHGHATGDALLEAVAGRLRGSLRADATIARLGGDEFAVLLPHLTDPDQATKIADRLIDCLKPPIRLPDNLKIDVQVSIGIDITTAGRINPTTVQRNADSAMYMAKGAGKAQHATFDPVLHGHLHQSIQQPNITHRTRNGQPADQRQPSS